MKGGVRVDELTIQIGPKEIYDKVNEAIYKLDNIGPRLEAVEKQSNEAHTLATTANRRSIENRRILWGVGSAIGTLAITAGVAWLNKHMW